MTGSEAEAIDFLNWFCDLPHKQKIFICGNHDACLYGANIEGLDTDVLISHSPAYGILDFDDNIYYGSEELLAKLPSLNLKAHLFGHIHAQHGILENIGTIYSNGAIMNSDYSQLNTPNLISL